MNLYEDYKINNSLRINAQTRYYVEINNVDEFIDLKKLINQKNLPVLIVGDCTNLVLKNNFEGIVVKPMFTRIEYDKDQHIVSVGAAVNWSMFVNEVVSKKIYGYENLSLIPGSVGASPIQNIGAYGQEISNLISKVHCYNYINGKFISLSNEDCKFSYRNSILKKSSYIIYKIDFITNHKKELNISYKSVKKYIEENSLKPDQLDIEDLSEIIVNIRNKTLPNPDIIPNVGSFFKNPIVKKDSINTDKFSYDDLILWKIDDDYVKVGAARLIELIKHDLESFINVSLYKNHSLIVVTNANASQDEVLRFSNNINDAVYRTFNINLEIEPIIIN